MSIVDTLVDIASDRQRPKRRSVPASKSSKTTIEILTNEEEFGALEREWRTLQLGNKSNRLCFQTHAWLDSWLSAFADRLQGPSCQLVLVTVRANNRLVLICPFILKQKRRLSHLCWAGEPASQYGDVVSGGTPASANDIIEALEHVIDVLKPDVIHLRKVRNDAAIQSWLQSTHARPTAIDQAPYQAFPPGISFDDYCARYSGKSRKNRRRLRRRLEETGTVVTQILEPGKAAQDAIDTALTFKQQWLVDRGQLSSALRDDHVPAMLRNFVGQTNSDSKPFVSVMKRDDGTTLSVQFGIIARQQLALHIIAYNPETVKTGAGVLHMEDTIRFCIENNITELDFLAPDAPYKRDWADSAVTVADYVVARSLKGRLYAQAYLNGTRDLLKSSVETLPLKFRKNLAQHWHK